MRDTSLDHSKLTSGKLAKDHPLQNKTPTYILYMFTIYSLLG